MKKRQFLRGAAAVAAWGRGHAAPERQRIRYGGDAAFAPFESLDAQGRPHGFQVDLLAELGAVLDVEFDIRLQPWAQTEADFRAGRVDVMAMVDTTARRTWARFTRGHATPALAVYLRRGQTEPQDLQQLVGLRIAVLDREAMRDTLATWLAGVPGPFVRVAEPGQALAAVERGDADAAVLPRLYADPLLAGGAASGVVAGHLSLALQSYAMAVAPGNEALRDRLQRGLDQLEGNGRLEALRVRWLGSHRDVAAQAAATRGMARQREWTWGLAGVSSLALALMGASVWQRGRLVAIEKKRRVDAEAALQRAEGLLERSFGQHPDAMLVVDRASAVVRDANAALLALLGVGAAGVIGRALPALAEHIDNQALQQLVESLDSAGALDAAPLRLRRGDGAARDCLVSADCMQIDGAVHVFCMVRDITEQLARDAALRRAYDDLAAQLAQARRELETARSGQQRTEQALDEFRRTISHDLKAPLNAVQGFTGLLRDRLLAGHVQEALGCTEHIARATQRMSSMIAALSNLAQVSRLPLRRVTVDMGRLARETWQLLSAAAPQRRIDIRIGTLPTAQADPDLAAQVWQNLLDNACKYSARVAEAKVLVDSHRDERGTWYRVTDNGAGFDMAKAQLLFQPFQRMHAASQFEGTGVGLSLVRRIIDHHGGEIRLRSAPGVGTVAEFTLDPAAATPA